jgi:polyphosphate kinase
VAWERIVYIYQMSSITHDPHLFINRELSLLQFNQRVFAQAQDRRLPLLERLKFLFICSANLDEFFEVRVAGLQHRVQHGHHSPGPDGLSAEQVLDAIAIQAHQLVDEIYQLLNVSLLPALADENIFILSPKQWNAAQSEWVKQYFQQQVMPITSPIGLDLAHPFPRLENKSLNFIVSLHGKDAFGRDSGLAVVSVPRMLPRVIRLPESLSDNNESYVLLNSIIQAYVDELFIGMTVTGCYQFRVTRNSDLIFDEDAIDDLAIALKKELFARRYGVEVRLEVAKQCPEDLAEFLLEKHNLQARDLYRVDGPVNLYRFHQLLSLTQRKDLLFAPFTPRMPRCLYKKQDLFAQIRQQDILLHHPYQSFEPVLEFIHQAALDPNVLVIKQTLYRVGANSPIVNALIEAARAGKQVITVIELRARFDEADNIELANRLQQAGALVVYGIIGYKCHAKMILVVRREQNKLKRYAHLGTGNYHVESAQQYTDMGLLTYDEQMTQDVAQIFQQLTGMGRATKLKKILQSPFTLHKTLLKLITHEAHNASEGQPAHIMAKMNALTEPEIIQALYQASQAGVKIDLIVRGICSLRPGIKGVSENITVCSIVSRFLEHSRVFYFYHHGEEKIFCSSADWMERNLLHRVETCFPIENKTLQQQVKQEGLLLHLQENNVAWRLQSDGSYHLVNAEKSSAIHSQFELLKRYS